LRIAAAADLRYALEDIVKVFRQQHAEVHIEPAYGSSGMFYEQLTNYAPFDLFLSADVQYPRKLAEQGIDPAGQRVHLCRRAHRALGQQHASAWMSTAWEWTRCASPRCGTSPSPIPRTRPMDAQPRRPCAPSGLYDAVKDKLVMGENISQTFQMAESGAAEVGIVALSLAMAPAASGQGHYWEVPRDAYPRIQQGGAILKWTRNPEAAQAFRAFLLAPEGRAILKRYGFSD
jgi:molybdate transport system substrate-binding protein